jgi:cell division septum initiation protein DivIVA
MTTKPAFRTSHHLVPGASDMIDKKAEQKYKENKEMKKKVKKLEKELQRSEKALAKAAALLV